MNIKIKRNDLFAIIKNDVFLNGKIHLIFLILIILSGSLVVITVHKTRLLIAEEELLLSIREKKNNEWRKLIIEKNAISISIKDKKIPYT